MGTLYSPTGLQKLKFEALFVQKMKPLLFRHYHLDLATFLQFELVPLS